MKKKIHEKLDKYSFKTKLKKGDEVLIISGKEKGKKGKIDRIISKKQAIVIPGLNLVKKHRRSRDNVKKPEIVEVAAPIHISNVMLIDPKSGKPTRIGYKYENGKKVRFAKNSGATIKDKAEAAIKDKSVDKEKDVKKEKKTKEKENKK